MILTSRQKRFLAQQLHEVGLSAQTADCLVRLGLKRVGDVARLSVTDMLIAPGLGIRSITEVRGLLAAQELGPGLVIPNWDERLAAQWEICNDDVGQQCPPADLGELARRDVFTLSDEQKRILAKPLKEVDLSVRTANCLAWLGLARIGDLVQLTESDLLRTPNFGRKCLSEVRSLLESANLRFGLHIPTWGDDLARQWADAGRSPEASLRVTIGQVDGFTKTQRAFLLQPLTNFSFSTRVTNALVRMRLGRVGDLAMLTRQQLRASGSLGARSLHEIQEFLAEYELALGTAIPEWGDSLHDEWSTDLQQEIEQIERAQIVDPHRDFADTTFLEDELQHAVEIALSDQSERNRDIVIRFFGLSGRGRKTLDEVGKEFGVTRERVRQIISRFLKRLRGKRLNLPILMKVRTFIEERIPALHDELRNHLHESKFCHSLFDITGVISALEVAGKETTICVRRFNNVQLVGYQEDLERLQKLPAAVRSLVGTFGCAHLDRLALELDTQLDETCLRRFVHAYTGIRWLDQQKYWFTANDAKRNRLANIVRKVLCVSPSIRISELRRGIKRVHRLQGFAPATAILQEFCAGLAFCRVEMDRVVATETFDRAAELGETELCFFQVLNDHGPVMHAKDLCAECAKRGMNENTFFQYLTYSPIIYRVDREVYAIIGADVAPGVVDDLRRKPANSPVIVDNGWTPDGRAWVAYRLNSANIRTGAFSIPIALNDLLAGRYTLGSSNGHEITIESGRVSGLRRAMSSSGAEEGDVLQITFDLGHRRAEVGYMDDSFTFTSQQSAR
jgi:DNA-directed RNA polymerase alpha subunit